MDNSVNKKYNLCIEVLTPLSIGAGVEKDWVRGVDYLISKGKLYKISLKKLVDSGIDIGELSNIFSSRNEEGLLSKIGSKLEQISDFCMDCKVESDNDVKSFIKNQLTDNPIIPGSSIKGAIRSILFEYFGGQEVKNIFRQNNNKLPKEKGEDYWFGRVKDGSDFMRFIKLSDSEFNETKVVNTKIFNLFGDGSNWNGGWKHSGANTTANYKSVGFNTLYECLMPGQKSVLTMMLARDAFNKYENEFHQSVKSEQNKCVLNEGLFKIINEHTKRYLKKEKDFFQKYSTDKTDKIVDSIDYLLDLIPVDNSSCILKMSAGSGFHSITGDWQYEDYTNTGICSEGRNWGKKNYKSRKIAISGDNFSLMGFVKLSRISENEYCEMPDYQSECIKQKERQISSENERRESERIKKELEKKERQEREKRTVDYIDCLKQCIEDAEKMLSENRFAEVLSLRNNCDSKDDINQTDEVLDLQKELRNLVDMAEQKKNEQEAQKARELSNRVPLSERIANATKFGTLFSNTQNWLKYNNSLGDNDKCALKQKIVEIYSKLSNHNKRQYSDFRKWGELVKLIGEAEAKQWFNDICN